MPVVAEKASYKNQYNSTNTVNMPSTCGHCTINISGKQKSISCGECSSNFHLGCVNNVGEDMDSWTCKKCDQPSLKDILMEIRAMAKCNVDMKDSLEKCHDSIERLNKLIELQDRKLQGCQENIVSLEAKCAELEKANKHLREKLNDQEQNTRLNSVEITGIPVIKEENAVSLVHRVGNAVNFKVENGMIDSCYRLKKNPNKPNEPPILFIKFTSNLVKNEFLKAKSVKRTLCVRDIDEALLNNSHNSPVYINNSLTRENKILLMQCQKFKREKGVKFVWVKNGKIHMRRDDKSKVFIISKESDLNDVH